MKKGMLIVWLLVVVWGAKAQKSDHEIVEELLHNTIKFYQMLRADNGLYYDYVGTHEQNHIGSVANVGIGLVAQCVATEMGWTTTAEQEIVETLEAVLGYNNKGIRLARTPENCFIHFFAIESGAAIGEDWSPIDTDLMLGGALFAKRYFGHNAQISRYADELFNMVNHSLFIGDWAKGQISLKMHPDGSPFGAWTLPYNEYMIVAWMARHHAKKNNSPAHRLWNSWYGAPENLPLAVYTSRSGETFKVPTDHKVSGEFTSNFTFMFNYLFVHEFSTSSFYQETMRQAALADRAWWHDRTDLEPMGKQRYEWGTTAGMGLRLYNGKLIEGYCVDRLCKLEQVGTSFDRNPDKNVAPSALSGYSPVLPDLVRTDLLALYRDVRGVGKMALPVRKGISDGGDYILWKYSYSDLNWRPTKIEGVDYACMLLGLAALPEMLGVSFFQQYNDFFNPEKPKYKRSK